MKVHCIYTTALAAGLFPFLLSAQETRPNESANVDAKTSVAKGKNIVKANITGFALNNYHLLYERQIAKKWSLSMGLRYGPQSDAPFRSYLDDLVADQDVVVDEIRLSNVAITPEIRWYPGARNGMKGFYLGAYGRFSRFNLEVPFLYNSTVLGVPVRSQANFGGPLTAFSGGLLMGVQYTFGKHFTIDAWLVGAHYGGSNGDLNFEVNPPLSPSERQSLQQALDNVESRWFTVKGTVRPDGTGGNLQMQGVWAGIRSGGLCLGMRF